MNPNTVTDAILTRIQADTGTGGLYVGSAYTVVTGGWYAVDGPITDLNTIFPYGVYNLTMEPDNTFTSDGAKFLLDFTIYDKQQNGLASIAPAMARLYGNAMLVSGRIPTYGFHRHVLTLAASATNNPLELVGHDMNWLGCRTETPSPSVITGTTSFTGYISAPAKTP